MTNQRSTLYFIRLMMFSMLLSIPLQAQYQFSRVGLEAGLNSEYIWHIAEDHNGILWLGGISGLEGFDGRQVIDLAESISNNTTAIPANIISGLYLDRQGGILVGSQNRILAYSPQPQNIAHWQAPYTPTAAGSASFSHFFELPNGQFLAAMGGSIFRLHRQSPDLQLLHDAGSNRRVIGFFASGERIAAMYDDWQIYWFNATGENISKTIISGNVGEQPAGVLLVTEGQRLVVAGANSGLYSAPVTQPLLLAAMNKTASIRDILSLGEDHEHNLLIGTQLGLLQGKWHDQELAIESITVNDGNTRAQYIYAIRTTMDGTLLLGTDRGLYIGYPRNQAVNSIEMAKWLAFPDTLSVAQDHQKNLWGAGKTLWRLSESQAFLALPEHLQALINVSHIFFHNNQLWVSHQQGIAVINPETLSVDYITLDAELLSCNSNEIISAYHGISLQSRNSLAFAVKGGVVELDSTTMQLDYIPLGAGCRPYGILAEGKNGALVTSRNREIWHIDNQFRARQYPISNSPYLFPFRASLNGTPQIWFTTGNGIQRWDETAHALLPPENQSLQEKTANWVSVLETDSALWVSTLQEGIHRITKSTGEVRLYGKQDGLLNHKYNLNAATVLSNGRLVFGGEEGLDIFHPTRMPEKEPLTLQISSLSYEIDGHRQVVLPLLARVSNQQISLPADARNIEFWLNVPYHLYAAQYRFRYQLSGLSDNWQTLPQNTSKFTLNLLPVGQYQLNLEVTSPSGAIQRLDTPLELQVTEPGWDWWYKKAFSAVQAFFEVWIDLAKTAQQETKVIYLLSAMVLLSLLVLWRLRLSRAKQQALQKEVTEKTQYITEQRNELQSLLHYRQDLMANIAHELKTPLTLILGVVTGRYSDVERRTKLERLVLRISRLLDNMLALSKDGSKPAEPAPIYEYQAQDFVAFYLTTYRGFVPEGRILLKDNQSAVVACVPDALDKLITNLINNAIKYSPSDSVIKISATNSEDHWQFSVRNQGRGIAKEQLNSVFERYVQIGAEQHSYGLGLGLPLVKQLVEAMGGRIEIASQPDEFTHVLLHIPIACQVASSKKARGVSHDELSEEYRNWLYAELTPTTAAKPTLPIQAQTTFDPPARWLVYCIDDNTEVLAQLHRQLSQHYQLQCFDNPLTALREARIHLPDIIVSDVMMPTLNGMDLVKRIRDDELTSHIPVILLTARSDHESQQQGLHVLADDYLTKPYQPQQLKARIDNLISIRQLLRTRFSVAIAEDQDGAANIANETPSDRPWTVNLDGAAPDQTRFMHKVIDYLQQHMGDADFSLSHLEQALHLSDSQIRRKTKAITGYSPQEILRIIRLESAAAKIREGEALKVIAHECGFSSQSHMGASFKAWFGKTPNQYRNDMGTE